MPKGRYSLYRTIEMFTFSPWARMFEVMPLFYGQHRRNVKAVTLVYVPILLAP